MSESADAIVVGGGIAGLSTALFLQRRIRGRVVVLDSAYPGAGASGHGSGIIRVHNSDPDEMLLAESGASIYRNWPDVIGGAGVMSKRGMAWLVGANDRDALQRNVDTQKNLGLPVELVEPSELAAMVPGMITDDLSGAAFEANGGSIIGPEVMTALTAQALIEGVEIRTFTPVQRLLARAGSIIGVATADQRFESGLVVVAGGAWTRNLLLTIGIDLPITAVRATLGTAYTPPELRDAPVIFDEVNDASFVPKWNGTSVLSARDHGHLLPVDPDSFDHACDLAGAEAGRELITRRLPALRTAALSDRWGAVDGCTPDRRPAIGALSEVSGLYVHAGANFKGIKVGPGASKGLSELILDGVAPSYLQAFDPDRLLGAEVITRAPSYAGSRWS